LRRWIDPLDCKLKLSLLTLLLLSLLNLVGDLLLNLTGDLLLGECKVLLLNGSGTPAGPVNGVNGGRRSRRVGGDTDTEMQELRDRQRQTRHVGHLPPPLRMCPS
jgi:hypothetical protein